MPGPSSITDEQRAQVLELHRQGKGRNEIAKTVGISAGSVTNIANAAGIEFDRAETAAATQARRQDLAKKRADAEADELEILRLQQTHVLDVLHGRRKFQVVMRGEMGVEEIRSVSFIPSGDLRNLAQAREKSVTIIGNLAQANNATGIEQAKSMLGDLLGSLKQVWDQGPDDA